MEAPDAADPMADVPAVSMQPEQRRPRPRRGDKPAVDFDAVSGVDGEVLEWKTGVGGGLDDLLLGKEDKALHAATAFDKKEKEEQKSKKLN